MRITDREHADAEKLRQLFQRLRGDAVTSFAEAEFSMGDVLLAMDRSGRFSNTRFHYSVERRLMAFQNACLEFFEDNEIRSRTSWAVESFSNVIDDRNALAHGSAKLVPDKRVVEVLKISPKPQNSSHVQRFIYDLDTMEDRVRDFDHVSLNIIALSWSLASVLGLNNQLEPGSVILLEENK